jgi:hypothetical protein
MQSKFHFGQVVFVLANQSQQIVPAIIQQEVFTRSFEGEKVSYIVQMGPKEKSKYVNLDKVDGEIFGTIEEVKVRLDKELQDLIANFNDNVEKLCNNALMLSDKWYGEQLKQLPNSGTDPNKIDPVSFINDNTPQPQPQSQPQQIYVPPIQPYSFNAQDQQQALRQTLMQRMITSEEVMHGEPMVQLPDGRIVPLRQGNQQ